MNIPCYITISRMIGTFCLLFTTPLSGVFFVIYTLCGLSDVLDGFIARTTNQTSELGAKLDSIADILFYVVMIIKIFPVLWSILPVGVWYAVGLIVLIRIASYSVAAIKYKRFSAMHTYLNKLSGFGAFLVPYIIKTSVAVQGCFAVCTVAIIASAHELLRHIRSKEYSA